MAERQRRGPVKNLLKYVKQFSDPKFNPERRTAMQMLAAAPVASKLKLSQGVLSQLDPVQFYRGLLTKGLDIAPEYVLDPKLLREAFLNELPDSDLYSTFDDWRVGGPGYKDDVLADSFGQAREDWAEAFASDDYDVSGFTPEQIEKLDKARALYDSMNVEGPNDGFPEDYDELVDKYGEAMEEFIGSMDQRSVVADYGGDDAFSGYLNAVRGEQMQNYIDDEAARLGVDPDVLVKELGVEKFLKQAPKIGSATGYEGTGEHGFIDVKAIPEYYYQDPEALRYASLRDMLEHPVLTPQQMLEVTHGEVSPALGRLGARDIASTLHHDLVMPRTEWTDKGIKYLDHPLLDTLDLERMSPDVRNEFVDIASSYKPAWQSEREAADRMYKRLVEKEPMLQRMEDVPSYIGNRTSPFRVKFNKADAGTKYVNEPLSYLDAIKALPPEEYSEGGRVE